MLVMLSILYCLFFPYIQHTDYKLLTLFCLDYLALLSQRAKQGTTEEFWTSGNEEETLPFLILTGMAESFYRKEHKARVGEAWTFGTARQKGSRKGTICTNAVYSRIIS
jgi:hypothetical protein